MCVEWFAACSCWPDPNNMTWRRKWTKLWNMKQLFNVYILSCVLLQKNQVNVFFPLMFDFKMTDVSDMRWRFMKEHTNRVWSIPFTHYLLTFSGWFQNMHALMLALMFSWTSCSTFSLHMDDLSVRAALTPRYTLYCTWLMIAPVFISLHNLQGAHCYTNRKMKNTPK